MKKSSAAPLQELVRILSADQVLTSPADLLTYDADGLTQHRAIPRAVVLPHSTDQVARVVRWCHERGVPFVPRGAGTGLSGGALPCESGIILELARMNRLLEVNVDERFAQVQVGLINQELSEAVREHGLFYAPDPSSQSACTIGGNIAENSGGPHCMKYGMTTQHILGATIVLPEGTVTHFGGPHSGLPGLDLLGLFVGSEGTFGVVTEALVALQKIPACTRLLFVAFRELVNACRAVGKMVARGMEPAALEMIDQTTIQVIEQSVFACGLPEDAGGVLLVELDGLPTQVDADSELVREISSELGAFEIREADDAAQRLQLWKGRKAAFGALGRLKPDLYVQDAVVPRSKLPEILNTMMQIARKHDVLLSNVFHAGDGNLHPNISFDGRDAHEARRVAEAGKEIMQACLDVGGALSGEHGIGREKRDFMPMLFSARDLEVFADVRRVFNPQGLCNPDKVLPGTKVCQEFRQGIEIPGVTTP